MRRWFLTGLALWLSFGWIGLVVGCSSEPEVDGRKVSEWVSMLRHQDWAVQSEASGALKKLGKGAVPYLKRPLRGKDPTMRRGVVITLAAIGPEAKDAIPDLLHRLAREEVPAIRAEILGALIRIDPKTDRVQQEFKKRLQDVDADVRAMAQNGLDALKAKSSPAPEPVAKPNAPVEPKGNAPKVEFALRQAVADQLARKSAGLAFGLVAEVEREKRRAAIFWPAIQDGKLLDDDLIAYVFEQKGTDSWVFSEELGPLGKDAATVLSKSLGGMDNQQVIRPCGVPTAELGAFLATAGKEFEETLAAGKAGEAMAAYERLTTAFSFNLAAYSDTLPEMLARKVFSEGWNLTIQSPNEATAEITRDGKKQQARLALRPCGQGVVISEIVPSQK